MSARLEERDRRRLQDRGLGLMAPAAALQAMDRLLGGGAQGCVGVFAWERERYRRSLDREVPAFYRRIFKSEPHPTPAPADHAKGGLATLSLAARTDAIERLIRETVASILGLDTYEQVERARGLFDLGIDSLTSVDLKNRLEKTFGQTLRTTIAFDYPTAAAMAAHLAMTLFPEASAPAAVATAPETDALDDLSAAELEDLLEQELKG
jgi:acyl carrier protein